MKHDHVLDDPAWAALNGKQAHLGLGSVVACRYHPDVAPFGSVKALESEAVRELASLAGPSGFVVCASIDALPSVEGVESALMGVVLQMVDVGAPKHIDAGDVVKLGADDVPDMMALTQKTKPGPFGKRTHEMGNYIGIRAHGRLVAMAGERMHMDGYTEISAVCVDDEERGKGLAGRLMHILRHGIVQRKDVPFLHVFENNLNAIALYERLGFKARQKFILHKLTLAER